MDNKNRRVTMYHMKLREWQELQSFVTLPNFNVDKYPEMYSAYVTLGEWLKIEADNLWNIGINVY